MLALAEDHRNDIVSNLGAIAFGAIASSSQKVWWFDPVGAILISAYIIWSWACILKGQVLSLTPLHLWGSFCIVVDQENVVNMVQEPLLAK